MAKKQQTEARMTAEGGSQANGGNTRVAKAPVSRNGSDEALRANAHIDDDDRIDERDRHAVDDHADMSDDDFMAFLRDSLHQSVLPDLPKIPGYHTFWATTTNSRDTVAHRQRLGYQFIKVDELPGWEGGSLKSGDFAGCVGINEMVAMKIPERRYQMMMRMFHHDLPLQEEEKIRATIEAHSENALRDKGRLIDEAGMADSIVQRAAVTPFA